MRLADWQNTPFTVPLLLIGLLCGWSAYVGWRRRAFPGAAPFALLMAAMAGWALVNLVEKSLVNHDLRRAFSTFVYVFIVTVPGAWLVFAARFSRHQRWLSRRVVGLLFVEPILVLGLVFTNPFHGLFRTATEMRVDGPYVVMVITQGPFFYVNAAYTYLLFAAGAVLLVIGVARRPGGTVARTALVIAGMVVPVLGNAAYVFRLQPLWLSDLTPVFFAVPGLVAAWLLLRVRGFDVLPIARDFVLDCLGDAVFVLDTRCRILDANAPARSLLPDPRGARRQPLGEAFPELGRCLSGGKGTTEVRLFRAGREQFWEVHVQPLADNHMTVGILVRLVEVTERRRAAEARSQLAAIVESSDDAIIGETPEGVITSWNPGAERLFGFSAHEVIGRPVSILVPPDRLEELGAAMERVRKGERVSPLETVRQHKDGTLVEVAVAVSPVRDEQGRLVGASSIARDITDRKQLEEQFRQSQKLEAIGRLAGGIAHDFNNLLTAIMGYAEVVLNLLRPDDPAREMVTQIVRSGERAASLTRQLLAFSRKQLIAPQALDVNAIVRESGKLLRRLLGEDIEFITALHPDLGAVYADPGQLQQVLVNLAINARDAMPAGGRLTITTARAELGEGHPGVPPGFYALLAVGDTGCGMTPEVQRYVFEPFFTTKGVGKGTGLGLATVYGIVKQGGGHIEVESEPGKGSLFRVYLPCADVPIPASDSVREPAPARRGTETVLLVEDEDAVRSLGGRALRGMGYTVLEAGHGVEALRVAEGHRGLIHLLATDVVMPHLSGRQLAERLLPLHPEMKVLYLSGYTDDAVVRHGVRQAEVHFLQKPFTSDTLAQTVREVLDE
jgi:PAS domain S-box-containing protein